MSEVKRFQHVAQLCASTPELMRLYPMATQYVLASDYDALVMVLSDPEAVVVNMMRGTIARPSLRSMLALFGEVFNTEDAANIEIAKLRKDLAVARKGFPGMVEQVEEIAQLRARLAESESQKPVAKVDEGDDGQWADILPDVSVRLGDFLYAAPVAGPAATPLTVQLGNLGQAFDGPGTKRAYTYDAQPGNRAAWKLGQAAQGPYHQKGGDHIDFGLGLLLDLQDQGFGVFEIADQMPTTAEPNDPCPGCMPGSHCRTPKCGRLKAKTDHLPTGIDSEGGTHD